MSLRHHSQIMDWIEQPVPKTIVGNYKSQMNVALFNSARQAQPSVFHQTHLDAGMTELVLAHKPRKRILNCHRRRSHTQDSGLPALEGSRSRFKQIRIHQETTALPKQIFALRSQPKTSTDPVEESYAQLRFERENLT